MSGREIDSPPAAATAEGHAAAVGATDQPTFADHGGAGKPNQLHSSRPRARRGWTVYCASTGRVWRYSGKRARVLAMLATTRTGVTQWDTLPWHTPLGGTIHVLREDGLAIETVREGVDRHARYWLRTPGTLDDGAES